MHGHTYIKYAKDDVWSEIYNARMDVYSFIIITSATCIRDVHLEFRVPKVKVKVSHIVNSKHLVL